MIGSGGRRKRSTFDGMRWGEGSVRTNEMTGPAIRDTSWQKSKEGYGSGWNQPRHTTKEERRNARAQKRQERSDWSNGLKGLIDSKRERTIKDPHADDDKGKVKVKRDGKDGYLEDQLMRNGSIACTDGGLCLVGEENGTPAAANGETLVYSIKNGERKWRVAGEGERGVSAAGGMFAWNEQSRTMGPGGVMVGRTWVDATGTGSKGNGTYYVKVTFSSSGGATAAVVDQNGYEATTDTVCCIPIYTIAGGKVTDDLRGAFVVPAWE